MWRLQNISATNIGTFPEASFDFQNKVYVVQARNLTDNAQLSNGSGKTTFIEIISLAILGYASSGKNAKSFVSWNSDKNYFTVYCKLLNTLSKKVVEIERKFYSNTKSAELVLLIDGKPPTTIPSKKGVENGVDTKDGNRYILNEILDINEDDLLNHYLVSKKHYQPFLQVNTDRKLEVISRFTNTSIVDKAIEKVQDRYDTVDTEIFEIKESISKATGFIDALTSSLNEDAEAKWEEEKANKIDQLGYTILTLDDEIKAQESRIEEQNALIDGLTLHIIDTTLFQELYNSLVKIEEIKNELSSIESEAKSAIYKIKHYLLGLIECPDCGFKFHTESEEQFTDEDLKGWEAVLESAETSLKENKLEAQILEKKIEEITLKEKENAQREREKINYQRIILSIEKQKQSLINSLEQKYAELDVVSLSTFSEEKNNVADQITEKQNEIVELTKQMQECQDELTKLNKWLDNFGNFKFYLGNVPIGLICSLVNQFLELNGSDLRLQIEGFKTLKSGELRQALQPVISRNFIGANDYNDFSCGEQTRLNLAVDLAFQQLINASSKTGGLDLYVNDEMLSGLDSLGIKNAAESFNVLEKNILLVSHSGSDLNYSNTITIEKKNKISRII